MHQLRISQSLSLPLDAVTQTFAILAKKGRGKSYTASVMAEEMLKANQQIVIIDPTGAWWGLKSSADGKSEGFQVVVFGGEHADILLSESAAEVIVRAIIERRFSAIIDLSGLSKSAGNRFMAIFFSALYLLNREPIHLFVDEADLYAPQKSFSDEARTLGAIEDIVRRGRKKGIGCTMITQRPAVINKNVLTQCDILITLGLSHPKDIDAVMEWVNVHADKIQAQSMLTSLPTLPIGTAWFWSPGWLDVFKKIEIRHRETFDSGATPKPGQKVAQPKRLAKIDIKALGESIEQIAEEKKANDPAELKRQIRMLQNEINKIQSAKTNNPIGNQARERQEWKDKLLLLEQNLELYRQTMKEIIRWYNALMKVVNTMPSINLNESKTVVAISGSPAPGEWRGKQPTEKRLSDKINNYRNNLHELSDALLSRQKSSNSNLPYGEKIMLIALAQFGEVNRPQLSVLSGYKSSSRDAYILRLKTRGLLTSDNGTVKITNEGITALGNDYEPLPAGRDLQNYWLNKLPEGEKKILAILCNSYPDSVERSSLDEPTGYKSSSRDAYLLRLIAKKLVIATGRGLVKASEHLF